MSHSTDKPPVSPTDRRYRIAFCITELDPGGAERQLVQLATRIDRRRFEPEVVCLSGEGPLVASLKDAGVPVTCLHARGRWDASVIVRLFHYFRRSRPDLVQTFLFHANIAGRLAARLARVPVVVSGIRVAERRHRWHLTLDRLTDRFVDRHVCVSQAVADFSSRIARLPADKLVVIPNGVDVELIRAAPPAELREFGIDENARVVLFVGRLDEQKDPKRLLDAFREIATEFDDTVLLFVGTGPLETSLREASNALDRRVVFAGYRHDVHNIMKAATCLVLPSRWEGMPNVVLEAIAAGLPVIASDAEGISEVLRDQRSGTIIAGPGPGPLAEAVRKLLTAASDGHTPQPVDTKYFTTEDMVARYEALYLELASKRLAR